LNCTNMTRLIPTPIKSLYTRLSARLHRQVETRLLEQIFEISMTSMGNNINVTIAHGKTASATLCNSTSKDLLLLRGLPPPLTPRFCSLSRCVQLALMFSLLFFLFYSILLIPSSTSSHSLLPQPLIILSHKISYNPTSTRRPGIIRLAYMRLGFEHPTVVVGFPAARA
jgi:hypothetical protein